MSSSSSYGGSGASISFEESPINTIVDQIEAAFDPLPLDRAQVTQAQLSGTLRARATELEQLRQKLTDVIPLQRENGKKLSQLGKQVQKDLEWLDKHLAKLEQRAKTKFPIEYNQAKDKIENPYL